MVKLLLSNGAYLHAEDADGMTPMLRLFSSVIKPHPFNVSQLYKNNKINWSNNSISYLMPRGKLTPSDMNGNPKALT